MRTVFKLLFIVSILLNCTTLHAQFVTSGSNVYLLTGSVGIGTSTFGTGKLEILGTGALQGIVLKQDNVTTSPFRIYNDANYGYITKQTIGSTYGDGIILSNTGNVTIGGSSSTVPILELYYDAPASHSGTTFKTATNTGTALYATASTSGYTGKFIGGQFLIALNETAGTNPYFLVNSSGNVGIGKTPTCKFDVNGTAAFGQVNWAQSSLTANQGGSVELVGSSATATPYIDFRNVGTDYDGRIVLDGSQKLQIKGRGGLLLDGMGGEVQILAAEGKCVATSNIRILGRNSCIGHDLVVNQGFAVDGKNGLTQIGYYTLGWYDFANNNSGENEELGPICALTGWNGIRFYTNGGGLRMTIRRDGIVQIFTKLEVPDIEVKNLALPDYVFSDDYSLRSIADVEKYIDENKHLPEVPSAKEVAEKGMNITEMNNALLKKVEELTLYLIEQNKQLQMQNSRIIELENSINSMR